MRLLLIPVVYLLLVGFAYSTDYNGTRLRLLGNIDLNECIKVLDSIHQNNYANVKQITIADIKTYRCGFYHWESQVIISYCGCNREVIAHELAHHQQKIRNESLQQAINHVGGFQRYLQLLINSKR